MDTAREFLIKNDKLISDAIEEGYDIRLSEEGILNAMEKYAEYRCKNMITSIKHQKHPICTYGDLCDSKHGYNNVCEDDDFDCKYCEKESR